MVVSCREYAKLVKDELKEKVKKMDKKPVLTVIQVGDDLASNSYIKGKEKDCDEVGITFNHLKYESSISEFELLNVITNMRDFSDGIIVQLPLPDSINVDKIIEAIPKSKDVDGFRRDSDFDCCTPKGIIDWLQYNNYDLVGTNVVVLGRSKIVGKPLVNMLIDRGATVTCCNSHTSDGYEFEMTNKADLVISAIGKPKFLSWSDFSVDCDIVVDVGMNRDENGKLCGDVDRESVLSIYPEIYVTPVPGGVGLLTRVSLLKNVVESYERRNMSVN